MYLFHKYPPYRGSSIAHKYSEALGTLALPSNTNMWQRSFKTELGHHANITESLSHYVVMKNDYEENHS
ncbi:hypothetical protein Y032_0093g2627 [Ancylostoma ceylanicum]|uniref:Uncharacterized protein n=1 Tax=Ancylostoma ceylanicum TaxID=53326 RepID=A0A016TKJ9_9BILA|nr:hypothetical protein Y032_0093g2627 [Ancylostoma ceylanicum]